MRGQQLLEQAVNRPETRDTPSLRKNRAALTQSPPQMVDPKHPPEGHRGDHATSEVEHQTRRARHRIAPHVVQVLHGRTVRAPHKRHRRQKEEPPCTASSSVLFRAFCTCAWYCCIVVAIAVAVALFIGVCCDRMWLDIDNLRRRAMGYGR